MTIHLVRHGPPTQDRSQPAHSWSLDPAGYDAIWALRERLPSRAAWFCSPEPKAVETAQFMTDARVGILPELAEHRRDSTDWIDDFVGTVRRAFEHPNRPAHPGWEPLSACRERVVSAVRRVVEVHDDTDVVLVGHGTAWTLTAADLLGEPPDLDRWQRLRMPDVIVVEPRS